MNISTRKNGWKIIVCLLLVISYISVLLGCISFLRPPEPRRIIFFITFGVVICYWISYLVSAYMLYNGKCYELWFSLVFPILCLMAEYANFRSVLSISIFVSSILWIHLWSFFLLCVELLVHDWYRYRAFCVISAVIKTAHIILPIFILIRLIFQGAHFCQDTCIAIWQTNLREAIEFIASNSLVFLSSLSFILLLVILIMVECRLNRNQFPSLNKSCIIINNNFYWEGGRVLGCLFIFGIWYYLFIQKERINRIQNITIIQSSRQYYADLIQFQEIRENNKSGLPIETTRHIYTTGNDVRGIILLGESHSKCYSSCYGFEIDTTPFLRFLRENNKAIFFQNAYSCDVMTTSVLSKLLTSENQYENDENSVTLFEVLRHCGFNTAMVTNQFAHHAWDTPIAAIGMTADTYHCLSPTLAEVTRCNQPDEALLPVYEGIKHTRREIVLLHFYAAHLNYLQRLPSIDYHTELKEPYFRALRYIDEIIEKIFMKYTQDDSVDIIVYLPDHGEHLKLGHDSAILRKEMIQIPMFIWFSSRYQKKYPEIVRQVEMASKKVFTNDLFFDLLLRILGIKHDFTPEEYDILTDKYILNTDTARTLKGLFRLDLSPLSNTHNN